MSCLPEDEDERIEQYDDDSVAGGDKHDDKAHYSATEEAVRGTPINVIFTEW